MINLKPCLFCGSDMVAFLPDEEQPYDHTTLGFIYCHGCGFSSDSYYSEAQAAEKWNRRMFEWNSVEDKLPEMGEHVLATNGKELREAHLDPDGWWVANFPAMHSGMLECDISHWMPLPEYPDQTKS